MITWALILWHSIGLQQAHAVNMEEWFSSHQMGLYITQTMFIRNMGLPETNCAKSSLRYRIFNQRYLAVDRILMNGRTNTLVLAISW